MAANSRDYFEHLAVLLEEHGFGWALSQVRSQIAEGVIVDKDVREFDAPQLSDASFEVRARRGRSARLIARRPYSDDQRLKLLLDAIEAVVVQRAQLEDAVLDSLKVADGQPKIQAIEFVADDAEEESVPGSAFRRHQVSNDRRLENRRLQESAAATLAEIRADAL